MVPMQTLVSLKLKEDTWVESYTNYSGGAWLTQLLEHTTVDLGVVNSGPMFDIEMT